MKIITLSLLTVLFSLSIFAQKPSYPDILHYDINLNITDFENEYIHGYTDIKCIKTDSAQNSFNFNLRGLDSDSVLLENKTHTPFKQNASFLEVSLNKNYRSGDTILIRVYYRGNPVEDDMWGGFFFDDNYAFNMGVGMASPTKSFAQVWYPCADDFREKASYDFHITVRHEHTAVCSGEFVELIQNQDGSNTWHWREEKQIPAYVTSVAVGEYELWEQSINGLLGKIPAQIYYNPKLKALVKKSFKNLPACLHGFEAHYGPYVWNRIGFVSVPFSSGAMEHNCNIAYPEYAVDGTLKRETLMAHELSHHWFGNLVTCATPGDMWLNEGWASYSEALFTEFVYGKEAYRDYVRKNHYSVLNYAHLYDGAYWPVAGVPEYLTYGSTVYDKGADMVHTLRSYMGDSLFFSSIKSYFNEKAFQSVSTEEFKNYLSKASGISQDNFFDDWIYEAGFPHFSPQSFEVQKSSDGYMVFLEIEQRLKARKNFADSVPADIVFYDEKLNEFTHRAFVSGPLSRLEIPLPFRPAGFLWDPYAKLSDASVHRTIKPDEAKIYSFDEESALAEFDAKPQNVILQLRQTYLPPNNFPDEYSLFLDSYWTVSGINLDRTKARIHFFNSELRAEDADIVLLFRENAKTDWKVKKFDFAKRHNRIVLNTEMQPGDYCIGKNYRK
jgi:aminopeptidase N